MNRLHPSRWIVGFWLTVYLGLFPMVGLSTAGQSGSATIIGQVTDESGAAIPGVTVTATSPSLQVAQVETFTDERGNYRLSPLSIGTYAVRFSLSGFRTASYEGIRLTADFTARVDAKLALGALEETITVSGVAPVVDVRSTATRTLLTRETLEIIPRGGDGYIGLMQQAPGARPNLDVGGNTANNPPVFRAFGQTGQSWQALDGVITANPKAGTQSGNYIDYSTFEEATISTLGHDASVPTRGIAINAIIKSGGNQFSGTAHYSGTNHRFQGDNLNDDLRARGIRSGSKIEIRDNIGGDLGGRLVRDKIWFYVGAKNRRDRENILDCFQADGSPCFASEASLFLTPKVTWQLNPKHRVVAFSQFNWRDNVSGASSLSAWESRRNQTALDGAQEVDYQYVHNNSLVTAIDFGRWWNHSGTYTAYAGGRPTATDTVLGTSWGSNVNYGDSNNEDRWQLKGSMTWSRSGGFAGDHEIRAGFQHFRSHANRLREVTDAPVYELVFRNGVGDQIAMGNPPVTPEAAVHYLGLYLHDSWSVARNLTLNLGIRFARDNGFVPEQCREAAPPPSHIANPGECFPAAQFNIFNSWAPRLRATYDVGGNGRSLFKGGWGRYMQMRYNSDLLIINRNVINRSVYRWRDLNSNLNYDPGEVNLDPNGPDFISRTVAGLSGALIGGVPSPDEKQPYTDEFMLQFERQLMSNFAVRVTGVYSQALNETRLANALRPYDVFNIPIINRDPGPDGVVGTADDPGTFITYYDYSAAYRGDRFQRPTIVNDPKANANYRSFEAAVSRRLANRWQLMGSYSITKNHQPLPTNVGSGTTFQANTQDPNSEIFALDDTLEWQARLSGSYQLPGAVIVSTNFEHRSGANWARDFQFRGGAQTPTIVLKVEPISANRRPNINLTDLRVEKVLRMPNGHRATARMGVFNLFNVSTVLNSTTRSGPNFGRITSIILPRILDFGVTYRF